MSDENARTKNKAEEVQDSPPTEPKDHVGIHEIGGFLVKIEVSLGAKIVRLREESRVSGEGPEESFERLSVQQQKRRASYQMLANTMVPAGMSYPRYTSSFIER